MDVAHAVLSGIVVAMGGAMIGKYITTRELREKLDVIEDKLGVKIKGFTTLEFCTQRHDALETLMFEKFTNIGDKLDRLITKIDTINSK